VSSMLAAGWGATSTVMQSASMDLCALSTPSVWRNSQRAAASLDVLGGAVNDEIEIPAVLRRQTMERNPASLRATALAIVEHLAHGGQVQGLAAHCETLVLHPDVRQAIKQAVGLGASEGHAWLLLAHWTNTRAGGLGSALVTATLKPHLALVDPSLIYECVKLFDRLLEGQGVDAWEQSRIQRLRQALSRTSP